MKKKDWVMLGLEILGVVMVVIAVCIPYMLQSMTFMGQTETVTGTLFDEAFTGEYATDVAKTAFAFGIITLISAAATLVLSLLSKFNILKTKLPEIVLGALTAVSAIIAIATLGAYCADVADAIHVFYKDALVMPHAGGFMLAVGGLLTGIPAVLQLKK